MKRPDDHFSPDHVDEQIEQQAWNFSSVPSQSGPTQDLLRALYALYEEEKNEDASTLDRAWSRLAEVDDWQQRNRFQKNVRLREMKEPGSFASRQFERPVKRSLTQRLGILAAVAFLVLLLGGTVFLFTAMTNGRNTHTGSGGPSPVTPTIGTQSPVTPTIGTQPPVTPTIGTQSPVTPTIGTQPPVTPTIGTQSPVTPTIGTQSPVTPTIGTQPPVTPTIGTQPPVTPTIGGK